jgi:hypothetical protein
VDPDSNPDQAFQVNGLFRIQGFDDQKLKKYSWEFFIIFFDQKLQLTYPYASFKDRKSLQPSKENIQNFKK